MPRQPNLTPAQRARDEGLARARRITWWTAIGAVGVTAAGAAIAANTIPGHALGQPAAASAPAAATPPASAATADPGGQVSVPPSDQQPQPAPVVVSGGS